MNDLTLAAAAVILLCVSISWAASAPDGIPWGVAQKPWNARWGNHRARVRVAIQADAVWAHIPWRRRDSNPQEKAVWVIDAATGKRVQNAVCVEVNREFGDVVFQAQRAGEYHVYYMPFTIRGRAFPTTVYSRPERTAKAEWARLATDKWRSLPKAQVVGFDARTGFDRMDPMEVIATAVEMEKLLAAHPDDVYLLFPEDRKFPIRMTEDLPALWARRGPMSELSGEAMRNEFYVFQVGLYAARAALKDVRVSFGELRPRGGGEPIAASALRCFNTEGRDWLGRPMHKVVDVPKGKVQALWCGVDVSRQAAVDTYEGVATIRAAGQKPADVKLVLSVSSKALDDRGDSELWRLSRLRWLDSKAGLEDEVTAPYTPLKVDGTTVKCLGRDVTYGPGGVPSSIRSGANEILARPLAFVVESDGNILAWKAGEAKVVERSPAATVLESEATAAALTLRTRARMEFDGYINFQFALKAERDVELDDCRLEIPIRRALATYMMGMGCKGGYRPDKWKWKWNPRNHQDSLWVGDVSGGLQCKLKGPDYRWPLVNVHYHRRPLLMPEAWHNGGKGGCVVEPDGEDCVVVRAYGGPRKLEAGKELRFDFALLVTPVKPLDFQAHWRHRYYHSGMPTPEKVVETGARIVNIHHGNALNPFINYPFLTTDKLADYVRSSHEHGLKVKLYYTIRELTNHVAELWALRSLGHEVYADGPGGGYAWLHEHLVKGYSPAWHQPFSDGTWCASISQMGLSRWHNYYIEGLAWLAKNTEIDGLYLDEIGYDREIMKRVRRVLDRHRPGSLLDLHSWNHFNGRAGFANCLNMYLEHLPFLDSLWIGEGRNYNEGPDHWMVEVSGIPFGLFSEMLQGGGNPWRGMLYGMTNRLPWSGNPRPIWKLWDDFGIEEAEMFGYWSPECPVRTGRKDVLATVYRRKGKSLVCLASWSGGGVDCKLKIDWAALGLDPTKAKLYAPEIDGIQSEDLFEPTDAIPVQPRGGWMFIIDEAERKLISIDNPDVYTSRKLTMEESFTGAELARDWQVTLSKRPNTKLSVADGDLVIDCTANTCAFAERKLPPETTLVECHLNSGNDGGQTWGVGLGLVWPKRFLRVHLRAEDRRFGYDDTGKVMFGPAARPGDWQHVRIRIEKDRIAIEGATERKRKRWRTIGTLDRSRFPGAPLAVRIGKMTAHGTNSDFPQPGHQGTCRIRGLRVYAGE